MTLPGRNNTMIEFYMFASQTHCKVITADGFTIADSIHTTDGTYQSALAFAYKYQE